MMREEKTQKTSVRYSKKREAIYNAIAQTKCHPSAEWLFQELKPAFPDLSLGTVYRNLSFFQEHGQIKSVGVVNGQERFDADISEHCHFICECCGTVLDLHDMQPQVPQGLEERYGFSIRAQELNLYGSCGACKGKNTILH